MASSTVATKRPSPDRESVSGSTAAQATTAPVDSHDGPRRAANMRIAAHAPNVRNRAVMFGSPNVMLALCATNGLGVQMLELVTYRTAPSKATARPDHRKAVQALR